jgi:hypothetical protein
MSIISPGGRCTIALRTGEGTPSSPPVKWTAKVKAAFTPSRSGENDGLIVAPVASIGVASPARAGPTKATASIALTASTMTLGRAIRARPERAGVVGGALTAMPYLCGQGIVPVIVFVVPSSKISCVL